MTTDEVCPECALPMKPRPVRPFPWKLQLIFGLSFAVFLIYFERAASVSPWLLWVWSGLQLLLGVILIRARILSKKTRFVCIRCPGSLSSDSI